jgi:hypothetical protein
MVLVFNLRKVLIIGLAILAGLFLGVLEVKAATTIFFDMKEKEIYEGDVFLVNLKISTPDKPINVVDGTILYDSNKLEIKEVSTGNSVFTLWSKPPVFSNGDGTLSFVGGTPDGFQGENGEVLKIIFLAKKRGEAKIDFLDGFSVFLHDGKGTQVSPWVRSFSLNILTRPLETPVKDEWQDLLEKDKTPPEFVEAVIGQNPLIFNNQYFVSFYAIDKESGISYYEVKEGERDFVRTESPYLLQDQSLKSTIQIKAVDKAGNEKIITPKLISVPTTKIPYKTYVILVIVVIMFTALILWLWRHRRMKIK